MEGSGSSFIPRRPTKGKPAAKSFRKVYVLSYVSYLVFFTTMLAVGGIFLYQWTLSKDLQELRAELVSQKSLFSESDLNRVRNLDYRIDAASRLVNTHASILTILNSLDNTIADPVQLLAFSYNRMEDFQQPAMTLSARAEEFDEVIFQEQIYQNDSIASQLRVDNVALITQPVDQEQLELGVEQVVQVEMSADLGLSDINFTGVSSFDGGLDFDEGTVTEFTDGVMTGQDEEGDSTGFDDESVEVVDDLGDTSDTANEF